MDEKYIVVVTRKVIGGYEGQREDLSYRYNFEDNARTAFQHEADFRLNLKVTLSKLERVPMAEFSRDFAPTK